jgi:hypothetical protein
MESGFGAQASTFGVMNLIRDILRSRTTCRECGAPIDGWLALRHGGGAFCSVEHAVID